MAKKKAEQEAMWFAKGAEQLFRSEDIPQANSLSKVRELAAAVNAGIATSAGLKDALKLDDRHVAYYRRAAIVLGVVTESPEGALGVSALGGAILAAPVDSVAERKALRDAILQAKPLAPFRSFFEGTDVDLAQLSHRIGIMTGLSKATADRRAQTLSAWRKFVSEDASGAQASLPDVQKVIAKQIETHNALVIEKYLEKLLTQSPKKFEELIAALVIKMGYADVVVTGRAGDGGVDVRGTRKDEWGHKHKVALQAKRYRRNIARAHVDQMIGVMTREHCSQACLITTAGFSVAARAAAAEHEGLRLVDGVQLAALLVEHEVGLRRGDYGAIVEVVGGKKNDT